MISIVRRHALRLARIIVVYARLERPLFNANLRRRFGRQPVVVYSLPKVGSTAMLDAARASGRQAIPAHHLSPSGLALEAKQTDRSAPQIESTKLWRAGYGGVWRGEWIAQQLTRPANEPWQIITGVRDPIARSISAFFHAGERSAAIDPNMATDDVDLARVVDRWVELYWAGARRDWFTSELFETTGIDVYATAFPVDVGHTTFERPHTRLLLIRNENISTAGPTALAEFLGVDAVAPPASNRASDKNYGGIYKRFISEATLPADVIDHAYGSRLATHFYSDAERAAFRQKWSRT